jgi:hypothetical protein
MKFPAIILTLVASMISERAISQGVPSSQTGGGQSVAPGPAPLTPWTFPNRDANNAGTVTIVTAPAGGAMSIFGSDTRVESDVHPPPARKSAQLSRAPARAAAPAKPSGHPATVLTLLFLPALYAFWFRVRRPSRSLAGS